LNFITRIEAGHPVNSDFRDLLSTFNAHDVRYLVVGGYAVMKYTEPRYTKDLDLWIEASPVNARAVFLALRAFGAPLSGITAGDFESEGTIYQMGRPPVRVDILTAIDGIGFPEAWANRVTTDFAGVPVHVIARQDLLTNKRASGRLRDQLDVESLMNAEGDGESSTGS
jgi:hypothetical protein